MTIVDLIRQTVELKRIGREYVGRCPWHDDHHPSLNVNAEKAAWICRACGAGGGIAAWQAWMGGTPLPPPTRGGRERTTARRAENDLLAKGQAKLDVLGTELRHALALASRRTDLEGRAWDRVALLYRRIDNGRWWMDEREPGRLDWPD